MWNISLVLVFFSSLFQNLQEEGWYMVIMGQFLWEDEAKVHFKWFRKCKTWNYIFLGEKNVWNLVVWPAKLDD